MTDHGRLSPDLGAVFDAHFGRFSGGKVRGGFRLCELVKKFVIPAPSGDPLRESARFKNGHAVIIQLITASAK